ncbi:hypothetical protein PoB_006366500 [Plakobranchus ocellatus]|uniref:Uncharacterized protein n=1 Tax=Plakobranchus ocellatus TaxID=259542 RepID=A0AAV4CZC8_9GAST|nr:hypothetical protein PoB_006366500 [Plakobranchus ocellatus]
MYYCKAKLILLLKSIVEEYKCGKAKPVITLEYHSGEIHEAPANYRQKMEIPPGSSSSIRAPTNERGYWSRSERKERTRIRANKEVVKNTRQTEKRHVYRRDHTRRGLLVNSKSNS